MRPDLKIRSLSAIVNEFADIMDGADCVIDFGDCAFYCPDILLEIAVRYMKRFPDALLYCEGSSTEFFDSEDIKRIAAQPYYREWYFRERSHRYGLK